MGARFSAPVQTGPGAHPVSCTMGTESFPVVKSGQGVTLTPHPLLMLWSRKSRSIPLFPLWAVRPVQNLSACTRVQFNLLYFLTMLDSASIFTAETVFRNVGELFQTVRFRYSLDLFHIFIALKAVNPVYLGSAL